jgi:hypothetical protein
LVQSCVTVGVYSVYTNRSWVNPVSPRIHWSNPVCRWGSILYVPTGLGSILCHLVYIGPMMYAGGGLFCMPQQVLGQSCITSYTLDQYCVTEGSYSVCPNRSWVNPVSPRIHWTNAVCRWGPILYTPTGLGPILYHLVYIGPMLCDGGGLLCMPKQVLGQSCITSYTLVQ